MSKKIIYMRSSDITLRYKLDEIIKLEKGCYNINDLLALKALLDTLEKQILIEVSNNATNHNALAEQVQGQINPDLNPTEEQANYVDSEYQLITPDYVNNLAIEILDMDAPFSNIQYNKLLEIERNLIQDIEKIVSNNNEVVEQVNSIKGSIIIADDNAQELREEAEVTIASDKLNLTANNKLVLKYETKIKGILSNTAVETTSEQNISKWLSNYTISYGTAGDDVYALIRLTNEINNLYASLNDTTDYQAMQLFANTVLNTIRSINEVTPENRQATLENAIEEAIVNESEPIQDRVRGLKASLARFSSDNYQFGEEDINILQTAANTASLEIDKMNGVNDEIRAQIAAKTKQLEQAKVEYQEKHDKLPDIDDVDPNQDPKPNTEGIENIINDINNVIDNELPYINDFELEYDSSEIGINEDPRQRVINIINVYPELHKDAEFSVEPSENENFTSSVNGTTIDINVLGTGNIDLDIITGEGDNRISKHVHFDVEPANISDFTVEYSNETMNENDERTIIVTSIEPAYHKETSFELVINENDDTFEVLSFNEQTGETTIKAAGTGDISFIIKNGEIEKQINIPVNIAVHESFVWYIGKNENNILGESSYETPELDENNEPKLDNQGHQIMKTQYVYNFNVNNLPTVSNINEIYKDDQQVESITNNIYVVCPEDWINDGWNNGVWTAKFRLEDLLQNRITLTDITNDAEFTENTNMQGLVLLYGSNTITDTVIKVLHNEADTSL